MNTQTVSELQIVEKPAFKVVGMKYHGKPEGDHIPKLWDKFGPCMDSVPNQVNQGVSYGVCRDMDMDTMVFDYLACVEVDSTAEIPDGMEAWDVPAATYAVFPATLATLNDTYMKAYSEQIPGAGYRHGDQYDVELYDEKFDSDDPASIFYVNIPIARV